MLLTIRSDDVAGGFSDYRKAVADEVLARAQLERASDLYKHGAMALNDLQVAQDTEDKAKVDLETTEEHLRLLATELSRKIMGNSNKAALRSTCQRIFLYRFNRRSRY